ncbi:hypothetical protein FACS18947_6420 [Bacteroidia bacterium]|nr:hypothetical protein FACS18947_6420 [Bacteroidia bacterium]
MKKALPIGSDDFARIRNDDYYYVDKTLLIKDFIEFHNEVTLITRPRRFGKTLNMTMLREFFDITQDSKAIFEGLAIMETEYSVRINSQPVIYFSFKDCTGKTPDTLKLRLMKELRKEYARFATVFENGIDQTNYDIVIFNKNFEHLSNESVDFGGLSSYIEDLVRAVHSYFHSTPILLLDEYDQPILSSYEYGYREELSDFFAVLYGSALKGNEHLGQALLTGIQRVAKESIFSCLNNVLTYTVSQKEYSAYFGLTMEETGELLEYYGLQLNESVIEQYDGYRMGGYEMFNPWSILNYAWSKELENYWINTSTNYLIRQSLLQADDAFREKFEQLIISGSTNVMASLTTSLIELKTNSTLWGLLVNSGYITIEEKITNEYMKVRIPNDEVKSEFQKIVAEQIAIQDDDLTEMFYCLLHKDMTGFCSVYRKIVLTCTSYFDSEPENEKKENGHFTPKENAYHMLFLGMCISIRNIYEITSNLESGYGRHDIRLKARKPGYAHIILEFKQGKELEKLKEDALNQIFEQQYYAGLSGSVLCIGIAHNQKRCEMAYREFVV